MNYYERHLGDYARDTGHLSMLEHGAYTLLIDRYYATEKGIDASEAHRLARARTDDEKAAVDAVLRDFFKLIDGFWHQKNCDEVIAAYRAGEPERLAKKSNEDTRMKRHRDERAALFARLNASGNHAAWNISIVDLRALVERTCNAPATQPATAPATPATATQAPSTNHQTPVEEQKQKGGKPPALTLPDWLPESAWADWHAFRNSRKGWTTKARELSLRTLTKLHAKGHDPTAVIERSIENGWTGLFEPKQSTGNNHANIQQGRKLSAVEQVEQNIQDRRERESDEADAFAAIGHG